MKHFKNNFRTLFAVFLLLAAMAVDASAQQSAADRTAAAALSADSISAVSTAGVPESANGTPAVSYVDSVEVSLLTCSPHNEVYSLYGHTALRWHDLHSNGKNDMVFNWGLFNFQKPYFVLRFIFGLTDYELGVGGFQAFCDYYEHCGSSVNEQVIRLSREEKQRLMEALQQNLQPENRVYRYNFFFDNCATRPRDMLERNVIGTVKYAARKDYKPTFREMVHQQTRDYPWMTFGIDVLLGLRADIATDRSEQEFLPQNLLYDFDRAVVATPDGSQHPLVSERRLAVKPGVQWVDDGFPLTPVQCALALLAVAMGVFFLEWRRHLTYKYFDVLLMALAGLVGCVLTLMVFSQHPCTSLNLQLLVFNPLPLFFLPAVWKRRQTRWWKLSLVLTCLFLIGGFLQHYADGMHILALCLLSRVWSNMKNCQQPTGMNQAKVLKR